MEAVRDWMGFASRNSYRFWLVAASFSFSFFFVLFQGGKLASMLFVIITILCVYLVLGRWSGIAKTTGHRTMGNELQNDTLQASSSLSVRLQVKVPGFWPIPYLFVKDRLVRRNGEEQVFESSLIPDWKRQGEVIYKTPPLRRGFYTFKQTQCSTEDVFGIFEHKGNLDLHHSFRVMPHTALIKDWRLIHQMMKGMNHHTSTTRALRETTQINGVREYIYGDRLSRVHWNATAKTGVMKSKEFERESLPRTIIILDRGAKAHINPDVFELSVSITATLLQYGAKKDLALGLVSVGAGDSVYYEPRLQQGHHQIVLNHLIEVEADGDYALIDILRERSRIFVPGSFIILISPRKGEAMLSTLSWIKHRQMNPCHIWIDPELDGNKNWIKEIKVKGYTGYRIHTLKELPHVMEGRF